MRPKLAGRTMGEEVAVACGDIRRYPQGAVPGSGWGCGEPTSTTVDGEGLPTFPEILEGGAGKGILKDQAPA